MEKTFKSFIKKQFFSPLFIIGFCCKCILVSIILSDIAHQYYVPFLQHSMSQWSIDPWKIWLNAHGDIRAFPYGYVMWLVFYPFLFLGNIFNFSAYSSYMTALLCMDILTFFMLTKIIYLRNPQNYYIYWFSPVIFLATYMLGYNDIVPVFFILAAIYYIKIFKFKLSGFFSVCAISAKLSMVMVLPFFIIYFYNHRTLRKEILNFMKGAFLAIVLFILPFLLSKAGLKMLINNPEMFKIYQYKLFFDQSHQLFIFPLCYLVMLYIAWRIQRMNFDMFFSILGLVFLLVVLLVPTAPGWFIWIVPFLVMYQITTDKAGKILINLFLICYMLDILILMPNFSFKYIEFKLLKNLGDSPYLSSILITMTTTVGLILWTSIWRKKINNNDFFRLSRKPFVIGIAGDSGSGKDTFSGALTTLFGQQSVVSLSGDDYHLWDRHKPMWQVMTHLNPLANNLQGFANDLLLLISGKGIYKKHYNHVSGKMSRPTFIKSNDIIIASGLHALYLPILRTSYHLSIYLDIDEQLRKIFKIARDTHARGHSIQKVLSSFERRESDSKKYIHPQKQFSDLVFCLLPIYQKNSSQDEFPKAFKLKVTFLNQFNEQDLVRILVGILGLNVDLNLDVETSRIEMLVDGDVLAEDLELISKMICPQILEFLDIKPKWADGMLGIMQLITLSHIHQSLIKRTI